MMCGDVASLLSAAIIVSVTLSLVTDILVPNGTVVF
jgi:hypothetical protein